MPERVNETPGSSEIQDVGQGVPREVLRNHPPRLLLLALTLLLALMLMATPTRS